MHIPYRNPHACYLSIHLYLVTLRKSDVGHMLLRQAYLCELSGSHDNENEGYSLLQYRAVVSLD
jgi:hypothetical protein